MCSNSLAAGRNQACVRCILFWHRIQLIGEDDGVNLRIPIDAGHRSDTKPATRQGTRAGQLLRQELGPLTRTGELDAFEKALKYGPHSTPIHSFACAGSEIRPLAISYHPGDNRR